MTLYFIDRYSYVDYGNTDEVPTFHLRQLEPEFLQFNFQVNVAFLGLANDGRYLHSLDLSH